MSGWKYQKTAQLGGIFDPERPLYETLENIVFANEKFSFPHFTNSSLFPATNGVQAETVAYVQALEVPDQTQKPLHCFRICLLARIWLSTIGNKYRAGVRGMCLDWNQLA